MLDSYIEFMNRFIDDFGKLDALASFIIAIVMLVTLVAIIKNRFFLLGYLKNSVVELKKVIWPTNKELTTNVGIVLGFIAIFAGLFYVMDLFIIVLLRFIGA